MNKLFEEHFYTVTDEEIKPTGRVDIRVAQDLDEAYSMALYTHRLHNGRAWQYRRLIICPTCGQTTITPRIAEAQQ